MSIPFSRIKDMLIAPRSLHNIAEAIKNNMTDVLPEFIPLNKVLALASTSRESEEKWLRALDAQGLLSDIGKPGKPIEYEEGMDKTDLLVDWPKLRNKVANPELFELPVWSR